MVIWYLMSQLWGKDIHNHGKIMTRTALVAHNKNAEEGKMILTEEVKEIFIGKD